MLFQPAIQMLDILNLRHFSHDFVWWDQFSDADVFYVYFLVAILYFTRPAFYIRNNMCFFMLFTMTLLKYTPLTFVCNLCSSTIHFWFIFLGIWSVSYSSMLFQNIPNAIRRPVCFTVWLIYSITMLVIFYNFHNGVSIYAMLRGACTLTF